MRLSAILSAATVLVSHAASQYTSEWSVAQDPSEVGHAYFDINGDGVHEITKELWNTVTLYDGAAGFSVVWYVEDIDADVLTFWDVYDLDGDGSATDALFISSQTLDTATVALKLYGLQAPEPTWTSARKSGFLSFLTVSDLDGEAAEEILIGVNRWTAADSSYESEVVVLSAEDGAEEWASGAMEGYLIGPYAENIDADSTREILFNLYDTKTAAYTLQAWSYSGGMAVEEPGDLPGPLRIVSRHPNPFRSTLQVDLEMESHEFVLVEAVDLLGRRVKSLFYGQLGPGRHRFRWDGRGENGEALPSGLYFLRAKEGARVAVAPALLVR